MINDEEEFYPCLGLLTVKQLEIVMGHLIKLNDFQPLPSKMYKVEKVETELQGKVAVATTIIQHYTRYNLYLYGTMKYVREKYEEFVKVIDNALPENKYQW